MKKIFAIYSLLAVSLCLIWCKNIDNFLNKNTLVGTWKDMTTWLNSTGDNTTWLNSAWNNASWSNNKLLYNNKKRWIKFIYDNSLETKTDLETNTEFDLSVRKIWDPKGQENADGVCKNCNFRIQVINNFIWWNDTWSFANPEQWINFMNSHNDPDLKYEKMHIFGKDAYSFWSWYLVFIESGNMYNKYDIRINSGNNDTKGILSSLQIKK